MWIVENDLPKYLQISPKEMLEGIQLSIYNVETMTYKDFRIRASVGKWGNSAAIRLPASLMTQAKLSANQPLDLVLSEGKIILEPIVDQDLNLADLLSQITPENIHGEVESGLPIGKEVF